MKKRLVIWLLSILAPNTYQRHTRQGKFLKDSGFGSAFSEDNTTQSVIIRMLDEHERWLHGKPIIQDKMKSKSESLLIVTYLLYVILFGTFIIGGFGYVVFFMGFSGWWMLAALMICSCMYSPDRWAELIYDKEESDDEE